MHLAWPKNQANMLSEFESALGTQGLRSFTRQQPDKAAGDLRILRLAADCGRIDRSQLELLRQQTDQGHALGVFYFRDLGATDESWLRRLGKNHLMPKVVRVEKPDEANQVADLKKQVRQLQQALG